MEMDQTMGGAEKGGENVERLAQVPSRDRSDVGCQVTYDAGTDEALKFISGHAVQYSLEDEKQVRRKIDLYILPW
jgi:hypothetical protein